MSPSTPSFALGPKAARPRRPITLIHAGSLAATAWLVWSASLYPRLRLSLPSKSSTSSRSSFTAPSRAWTRAPEYPSSGSCWCHGEGRRSSGRHLCGEPRTGRLPPRRQRPADSCLVRERRQAAGVRCSLGERFRSRSRLGNSCEIKCPCRRRDCQGALSARIPHSLPATSKPAGPGTRTRRISRKPAAFSQAVYSGSL